MYLLHVHMGSNLDKKLRDVNLQINPIPELLE